MLTLDDNEFFEDCQQHYTLHTDEDTEGEKFTFFKLAPKKSGKYLNYGCCEGKAVDLLRNDGWDVYGYEPFANKADSSNPYIITSKDEVSRMRFDGLFSNNVLEHLTNPLETLLFMKSLLVDDSCIMVHSTPCYEYLYEQTRFHLIFYTGQSIFKLSELAGLIPYNHYSEIRNGHTYTSYHFKSAPF